MKRHDSYPSRNGSESFVMPRKDPVVYWQGRAAEADSLSHAEMQRFEERGALSFEAILPPHEIAAIVERAEALRIDPPRGSEAVVRELGSNAVRSIFAVHELDPVVERFVADPRIFGLARQLLGSEVYVHQSRINYKPAFGGKEFYWHSDFETWHVEDGMPRMRACSLSINLTANRPANGPLMFMPGSHHHFVCCSGTTPDENYKRSLRRQEIGVPPRSVLEQMAERGGVEVPTGPAGSAVLFDCNLIHGSNGNITPYPRTNLFLVFNSVDNPLESPFSGGRPRPEFIASRAQRTLS